MPLIDISIAEGRSPEQLRALIDGVHRVAESTVGAAPENITVIVREVPHAHWSRTNQTIAERAAGAGDAAGPGTH
ncbi:4-oxalocrotonate tautomerase family protein [Rothia sp. AR01]|uniref:4-oxalocrotonate tautomerase family protein n=1 Tax=Rothia santali TaxID=2949643 RepID=A0A9X2KIJ6_9MICC|nr:tautomerase family protein [Rothia santali]MCP3426967.1 4-oxalocrotonate tautomerase family protein [Rothia santali]